MQKDFPKASAPSKNREIEALYVRLPFFGNRGDSILFAQNINWDHCVALVLRPGSSSLTTTENMVALTKTRFEVSIEVNLAQIHHK